MSYAPVRGLGWTGTMTMKTPWGTERASITVPIEQAADAAMNAVWPIAEQKMYQMLPGLMDMALKKAGGYVTGDLWPKMKPLMQGEVDIAIRKGEVVADNAVEDISIRAGILGGVLITAIAGAAWWIGRSRK